MTRAPAPLRTRTAPATPAPRRGRTRAAAIALVAALAAVTAYFLLRDRPGPEAVASAAPPVDPAPSAPAEEQVAPAPPPVQAAPRPPLADAVPRTVPPLPGRPATDLIPRAAPHRQARGTPAPVDLFAGLRALQATAGQCAPAGGAGRSATFLLDLETLDQRVRVVEASLQNPGGATPEALSCAQGALVGREIAVKASQPGGRFQFPLTVKL